MQPHVDPTHLFGQDLIKVFGPKAHRRHISTLNEAEKRKILNSVPVYVDTDDLVSSDNRCSFYQVTNKILTILAQRGVLQGIDLDWCTDLRQGAIVRHSSAYFLTNLLYKNNRVQRGIQLRHLMEDILFSFNPSSFLSGLARVLSDGTANLNNGQHRTVAAIIVGIREIPIEYINSDKESVDIDLYATDNLDTLAASEFDQHRIRVWRNIERKNEGRKDLEAEDIINENIYNIHAQKQSRFIEKGTENPKPLECTGVGNMIKYYKEFGEDHYRNALDVVTTVWYKSPISTANCWGLMEFFKTQKEQKGLSDDMFIYAVQQAIAQRYSDPSKSGMHREFKRIVDADPTLKNVKYSEPKLIAAGIYKIVRAYTNIPVAPIMDNGQDMAQVLLKNLRIMPTNSGQQVAAVAVNQQTMPAKQVA